MPRNPSYRFYGLAAGFLLLLLTAYANHFDNGFYFDDVHTIVENEYIRDLGNFRLYFTDPTTFSSLPANQAYRPMVTMLNAIDYRIAGGLDPYYFHLSMFFWFLVQLTLVFVFFRNILDRSLPQEANRYIALFATAFYGLHTINAETLNYIISRSDSFSTLCVVASFVLYQYRVTRKYHLYLLTMVLGIYTKQTGVMFAPLLWVYIFCFEEEIDREHRASSAIRALKNSLWKATPALLVAAALIIFNQLYMTSIVSTNVTVSRWQYLTTQFYVITTYLGNFVLPIRLSADPDIRIITPASDPRILAGLLVILVLVGLALFAFKQKMSRPITFGIAWFFISLAPTSSLAPLYQIANDHRLFMPIIGLSLSTVWFGALVVMRFKTQIRNSGLLKYGIGTVLVAVFLAHAWGVHQRNSVWGSAESLWLDVTKKSPDNGRGLMNYGVSQMSKGEYDTALEYFERALVLNPRYSFLHVNMAILKNVMGAPAAEVERYFVNAKGLDARNPAVYYYYAQWLARQGEPDRAIELLGDGLSKSPGHSRMLRSLGALSKSKGVAAELSVPEWQARADEEPSAEHYLELSLAHYRAGQFELAVSAAEMSLSFRPAYSPAYNSMCSAYNRLERWDKAIAACEQALSISPKYGLAKNNLRRARSGKANAGTQ